jgi:hypothetical protein
VYLKAAPVVRRLRDALVVLGIAGLDVRRESLS